MTLKTNLHFHTAEDPRHMIPYSIKEGVDHAAQLGFEVLAVTCHDSYVCGSDDIEYAKDKGVLLIPGIEADIYDERGTRNHVILLNGTDESENVHTFGDLYRFKERHTDAFVIAPHPYFYGTFSLHENLEKHIGLFDAIEHSWFYSTWFNRNKKAQRVAEIYDKPLVATSDTHFLDFFDTSYITVDAEEKTPESVFRAIKQGSYTNTTSPCNSAIEMFWKFGKMTVSEKIKMLARRVFGA